jgi:hypothetical protein
MTPPLLDQSRVANTLNCTLSTFVLHQPRGALFCVTPASWSTSDAYSIISTFCRESCRTCTLVKMARHPFDTFRLRGLPSNFPLSTLTSYLSQNKLELIGNVSLAPDAACSCSARTATLTLKREQDKKFKVPDSWGQVCLQVDEVMEGFTPLNDVGDNQDYVEYISKPPRFLVWWANQNGT